MIETRFAQVQPTVYDLSDRDAVMRFVWFDTMRLCEARDMHAVWEMPSVFEPGILTPRPRAEGEAIMAGQHPEQRQ